MPRLTRQERRERRLDRLETPTPETQAPSNAAVAAEVQPGIPVATPVLDAAAAEVAATPSTIPAWAQAPHVSGTLKEGSEGEGVKTLQRQLDLPETGVYDAATKAAVQAWQKANGLKDDGIAGGATLGKLGLRQEFRSPWHSEDKFIPKYRATAYSESNSYRNENDPYAVGAISRPTAEQDLGGKTYGAYQFESSVYADGTTAGKNTVAGSTVMRFVNDPDNTYGPELKEIVKKHGVASAEFDAKWAALATDANGAFGRAQEKFLEKDKADEVKAWMDTAKVSETARVDPELYDVVMGTVNQYGGLATGMAERMATKSAASKTPLTADAIGTALQNDKASRVESTFKSSPKAWDGIRERISREKKLFSS